MIRFSRNGSRLFVGFDLSATDISLSDDERAKLGTLWLDTEQGNPVAAAALMEQLRRALDRRIERIRREAYAQGAKDRASKARLFSNSLCLAPHSGGCYR